MNATRPVLRIEPLGEDALLLRLGDTIDEDTNRRVHALAARIAAQRPAWLRELVPGYASLALCIEHAGLDGADAQQQAARWLHEQAIALDPHDDARESGARDAGALLELPVCYGGTHGPDLDAVAAQAGLAVEDVIARHAAGDYRVAMLGFAPGFPYLLGLDPALATPRLDTPRTRVPAGSLGIGGAQTGVYPHQGPGGWRLIGRTPAILFDATRGAPSLLLPGQRVRLVPIAADAFDRIASQQRRRTRA